MHARATDICL
jgi:hypothetical protein